ncbi:MAG: hypothetical protein KF688_00940 [Pirellulales bacterium]|nr:hypothetical protein [Pirellulales bacterium]
MTRPAAARSIALVVACEPSDVAADKLHAAIRSVVASGLPLTLAADEAAILLYRGLGESVRRTVSLVPVMPGAKESASLESRLAACRAAAGDVHAVYLPTGGTLHGAIADLKRLGIHAVIDAEGSGRRVVPIHVRRVNVDLALPSSSVWRQLLGGGLAAGPTAGHAEWTVVISAMRLAAAGFVGQRQVRQAIAALQRARQAGAVQLGAMHTGAATARRSAPQQSILRAA